MLPAHEVFLLIVGAYNNKAVAAIIVDKLLVYGDACGIKIGAGFVEQENGNIRENGQGQLDALFHPGRKVTELFVGGSFQSNQLHSHSGRNAWQEIFELLMELDDFCKGELFNEFKIWSSNGAIPEKRIGGDGFFRRAVGNGAFVVLNGAADHL